MNKYDIKIDRNGQCWQNKVFSFKIKHDCQNQFNRKLMLDD